MKKLAVITVTYNRREYCEKAVTKLLDQLKSSDFDFRIFICDNNSSDDTVSYLKQLEASEPFVDVFYSDENLGTAEGYRSLLREKVFGQSFDFILKNDDDETLPDDWSLLLDYWPEIESHDVLVAGFRRPCTNDYFENLKWIARTPEHMTPIWFGDNECYLSYIAVGPQMGTEAGWRAIDPGLTDYGEKFGGWDVSMARQIQKLGKKCLVVYNKECQHFQKWEDHPEYTQEKKEQIARVREKIAMMK